MSPQMPHIDKNRKQLELYKMKCRSTIKGNRWLEPILIELGLPFHLF